MFGAVPSVWHKEILFALTEGVRVLGAASLGALRAAECSAFGMEPVGSIAADYLNGRRDADADVCLAHCPAGPGDQPPRELLVDVEGTPAVLLAAGDIALGEHAELLRAARELFFADRTPAALIAGARLTPDRRSAIHAAYTARRTSRKTADALLLVERLHALPDRRGPPPDWTFVASDPWRHYLATR